MMPPVFMYPWKELEQTRQEDNIQLFIYVFFKEDNINEQGYLGRSDAKARPLSGWLIKLI